MQKWYTEKWSEETKFSIKYDKKLHSEKSEFQKIDFYHSKEWGNFFTLDDLMMVTEKDEFIYHDMIVHPALATNPEIKNVLVIGGGDGGTVRELCRYNHIEKIDMVEIDKRVVELSQIHLPQTSISLTDSRVNLLFIDGIKFIKEVEPEKYDLILVDSTDPFGPGEGLFSNEFYKDCYNALSKNGILINQHESPYLDNYADQMQRAQKRIKSNFPISAVYQFHQATYPSGHWLFGFASKSLHPLKDHNPQKWENFGLTTKYYNSDLHKGAFMLPTYVIDKLNSEENSE